MLASLGRSALRRTSASPFGARTAVKSNVGAVSQIRNYRHWWACTPDDFGLPHHSMPDDIKQVMADPGARPLDYIDNYWYWRIRKESTVLNPEKMVKTSYKQLAYDMGMPVVNKAMEHQMGLIELYEYLKVSPFIGPWGSIENPALVPSTSDVRMAGCTGGTGDDEHRALYFNIREGFMYRCGECDQIYMLVRITYANTWDEDFIHTDEIYAKDPDIEDVFDPALLSNANEMWNKNGSLRWSTGLHALNLVRKPIDRLDYFPTPEEEENMDKIEQWYRNKFAAMGKDPDAITNSDRMALLADIKNWPESEQIAWAKLHNLDKQLSGDEGGKVTLPADNFTPNPMALIAQLDLGAEKLEGVKPKEIAGKK